MAFPWLLLSVNIMLVVSQTAYYHIDADDIYTTSNAKLEVYYNISSTVNLTCSNSDGLFSETVQVELSKNSSTISIQLTEGSNMAAGAYQVTCTVPELFTFAAIVTVVEKIAEAVCSDTISSSVVYIHKLFDKVTFYQNGLFIVDVYPKIPNKDFLCLVYEVQIVDYVVQDFGDKVDYIAILQEKKGSYSYTIFPNRTTISSSVYGVKCSADDLGDVTFVFEFSNTSVSTVTSDKLNFEEYISVDCSCDTTLRFCDSQCCCDNDCSPIQTEAFGSCISGARGGDTTTTITPDCNSDIGNVAPWERALCVTTSNSAFLGTYFNFVNGSLVSENKWNPNPNKWNNTKIVGLLGSEVITTTKGSPILTHSEYFTEGLLSLPGSIGGACVPAQPLKLFQDSDVQCRRSVPEYCSVKANFVDYNGAEFHARSYLSPTEVLVDNCKWYTLVDDATIKVYYKQNGSLINHRSADILQDDDCKHAVTDVVYVVTVNERKIVTIIATITLQDLRAKEGDSIVTRYIVKYIVDESNLATETKPIPAKLGYSVYDTLVLDPSSNLILPKYGDCNVAGTVPKFKVATITQCYIDIAPAVLQNCTLLFEELMTVFSQFIENGTKVAETLGSDTFVSAVSTNTLDTYSFTENELCDNLPAYLHIKIYHKNNTDLGSTITNISYHLDYAAIAMMSGSQILLYADLQYLISDVTDSECVLCWEDLVFFQTEQGLLNSLLVIFAGLVYFAIPRNWMFAKL